MAYRVKNKRTGSFLQSPFHLTGNDTVWVWTPREADGHHFASRGEAKELLRSPGFQNINMRELTFLPV